MKNTQNDGGPAFPGPDDYATDGRPIYDQHMSRGMSLRDYFAAKALQAIIAPGQRPNWALADDCADAYRYADAMLRVRENGNG